MRALLIVAICVSLAACGKKPPVVLPQIITQIETIEVKIPVPVKIEPPAELLTSLSFPIPLFVAPAHPQASSALTVEGERELRALIEELLARLQAWVEWATAK